MYNCIYFSKCPGHSKASQKGWVLLAGCARQHLVGALPCQKVGKAEKGNKLRSWGLQVVQIHTFQNFKLKPLLILISKKISIYFHILSKNLKASLIWHCFCGTVPEKIVNTIIVAVSILGKHEAQICKKRRGPMHKTTSWSRFTAQVLGPCHCSSLFVTGPIMSLVQLCHLCPALLQLCSSATRTRLGLWGCLESWNSLLRAHRSYGTERKWCQPLDIRVQMSQRSRIMKPRIHNEYNELSVIHSYTSVVIKNSGTFRSWEPNTKVKLTGYQPERAVASCCDQPWAQNRASESFEKRMGRKRSVSTCWNCWKAGTVSFKKVNRVKNIQKL